jgi:hypothetical protein
VDQKERQAIVLQMNAFAEFKKLYFNYVQGRALIYQTRYDRVRPTMSILKAAQVMTDKSNHRMLVKEGKSATSMSSTKL